MTEQRDARALANPRAMASLSALAPRRNQVQIERLDFQDGLPREAAFVLILGGQRASIVLGRVPDDICADMPKVMRWADEQMDSIAAELNGDRS